MNTSEPRFFGAFIDPEQASSVYSQPADRAGQPLIPEDARRIACHRPPTPTTTP